MQRGSRPYLKARIRANKKWRAKNPHKLRQYRKNAALKRGVKNSKYYEPDPLLSLLTTNWNDHD